ncbi:fimbrial protein [Vibrio sp. SCSIO 43137]|uniref:fimbrial protein n=1 Tax=Vibrio sp. SCSIO 43137 TaxID=3021011 RepID=UPI002307FD5D|nr:fimbrial protein [Vibrio sp. SCSIO 43137]WCE31664.1 fimbrial protein [Vibrio sp. SCSIO 43137]
MLSSGAYAADGTITFTGNVYKPTCSVVTDSQSLSVTLPPVSSSAMAGSGTVFGYMPFEIQLADCNLAQNTVQKVGLMFAGTVDSSASDVLVNEATGASIATGVGVAIYTGDGATQLVINGTENDNQDLGELDASSTAISGGTLNLPLVAKYYNYGGAASPAGSVSSSVAFSVTYQ